MKYYKTSYHVFMENSQNYLRDCFKGYGKSGLYRQVVSIGGVIIMGFGSWKEFKVVTIGRWSLWRGGHLDRFDCIYSLESYRYTFSMTWFMRDSRNKI